MKHCDVPNCRRDVNVVLVAVGGERFGFCAVHAAEYRDAGYQPTEPDQLGLDGDAKPVTQVR